MKLSNLLTLMADHDHIKIFADSTYRLPTDELYKGRVIDCYHYPKLLKRKVTFFYAIRDDVYILIK